MPKKDLKKVMVIGSGPIVIGQAAEFDYSGTQACKALHEEGIKVVLVNSNPATIQTDLTTADIVYIEPLTVETITKIIEKERPDGLIATMGGQTGLNMCTQLYEKGILKKFNVELLGTPIWAIEHGENRESFKKLMDELEIPLPRSKTVNSFEEAKEYLKEIGFPVIIRPAYTMGGTGGGVAFNEGEFDVLAERGLGLSMIHQILVEEAILGQAGWGEIEFEVVRDGKDNCIIICSMENVDPMGVHTGDAIVVAPALTLNNEDYQMLRSNAIKIIRGLRIEGGCNVQFAFNYHTGDYRIIEVNPRLSRSSALASKATGYPIARVATKIAVGKSLDEIPNDVTGSTSACFEPSIDYVVSKFPRWPFDKFRTADRTLGSQMKATGETMSIGRNFEESIQKAIRSLEIGRAGLGFDGKDKFIEDKEKLNDLLEHPTHERIFHIRDAIKLGYSLDDIYKLTGIHKWFLKKLKNIWDCGSSLKFEKDIILNAKKLGFSDKQIAFVLKKDEEEIRKFRIENNILPTYKMVDTCAAEFEAITPYLYSTYEHEDESNPSKNKKIIMIGGGPIRIGQGIEFDYCCVHSVYALREEGYEALIINNNPETVSTDYDTSDKLYFEPLTYEDVLNIIEREKPEGVVLQFGGQTPINMAMKLHKAGVNIFGTQPESIDIAEDRKKFGEILSKLDIPSAEWGTAMSVKEALVIANKIKYPVLVRPSYVLGGRAMQIVDNDDELMSYMEEAVEVSPEHPVLIDKYLANAVELDVDALSDGKDVFVAAIMEHIEEAGVHSGDSACVIPPQNISKEIKDRVIEYTKKLAMELKTIGLINIQMAIKDDIVYILEANPRASRTVPYVSKTIGIPLAKMATKIMLGKTLEELGLKEYKEPNFASVKEVVFPFLKLHGVIPSLGPEMQSTGEVMGIDKNFDKAFYKAEACAGTDLPKKGNILFSVGKNEDKKELVPYAKQLAGMGFKLYCTRSTRDVLKENGIDSFEVPKIRDNPIILDMMKKKELDLIINIHRGTHPKTDSAKIRISAVELGVPYITTVTATKAAINSIKAMANQTVSVNSLEGYYKEFGNGRIN